MINVKLDLKYSYMHSRIWDSVQITLSVYRIHLELHSNFFLSSPFPFDCCSLWESAECKAITLLCSHRIRRQRAHSVWNANSCSLNAGQERSQRDSLHIHIHVHVHVQSSMSRKLIGNYLYVKRLEVRLVPSVWPSICPAVCLTGGVDANADAWHIN